MFFSFVAEFPLEFYADAYDVQALLQTMGRDPHPVGVRQEPAVAAAAAASAAIPAAAVAVPGAPAAALHSIRIGDNIRLRKRTR